MPTDTKILDRVRKLLAKAEAEGVTPPEAEALTAKASELMARYGIDAAMASARADRHEKPGNRIIDIVNPWASVRAHLLAGIAGAMGCQCVLLSTTRPGARLHVFGFESDLARVDLLYTSLLLQMASALRHAAAPPGTRSVRAWNRSFLLGYVSAVISRVKAAEDKAKEETGQEQGYGSMAVVLRDRSVQVKAQLREAYPTIRMTRITYSGRGYSAGYDKGQKANLHNQASATGSSRQGISR